MDDAKAIRRFIKLPTDLLERTDLTPAQKIVLAYIANRASGNGTAWPSLRTIARDCGMSPAHIHGSIGRLSEAGLISVESGVETTSSTSNLYRLAGDHHPQDVVGVDNSSALSRVSAQPSERSAGRALRSAGRALSAQPSEHKRTSIETQREPEEATKSTGLFGQQKADTPTTRARGRQKTVKGDPWDAACAAMRGQTLKTETFKAAWLEWWDYRRQTRKAMTSATVVRQIHRLEEWGHDDAIESINNSISNGWQGLFFPDKDRRSARSRGVARIESEPGKYDHIGFRLPEDAPLETPRAPANPP